MKLGKRVLLMLIIIILPSVNYAVSDEENAQDQLKKASALANSKPEQAIVYYKEAYEYGLKNDDNGVCSDALEGYAWCMHLEGDDELALNLSLNALYYCPRNQTLKRAKIKSEMGVIYSDLGNYDAAEKSLFEALRIFSASKDSVRIYKAYINLGMLYGTIKNVQKSTDYNLKALALVRKYKDWSNECRILNNLGSIGDNYDVRLNYLHQALHISTLNNDLYTMSACYANMADCYYYQAKYPLALQMLDKSDEYAGYTNAKTTVLNNLHLRSQIYKTQKDYAMALTCMERYIEESKRLNDEKLLKDVENETMSRKMLKLKAENELEKKENELINERIYWIIGGAILLVVVLLIILRYYVYRKHKEAELVKEKNKVMELMMKQKEDLLTDVNSELQRAQERLQYLRLFLQTRNELLENIREQIRKSYKLQGAEQITFLKNINTNIAQYQVKRNTKDELSEDEKKNEEFKKRLKDKYPSITQVELKLATYLRANLSNKEIALLIGAQIKTIETNRYRLRKVLGLDADTNVNDFLRKI